MLHSVNCNKSGQQLLHATCYATVSGRSQGPTTRRFLPRSAVLGGASGSRSPDHCRLDRGPCALAARAVCLKKRSVEGHRGPRRARIDSSDQGSAAISSRAPARSRTYSTRRCAPRPPRAPSCRRVRTTTTNPRNAARGMPPVGQSRRYEARSSSVSSSSPSSTLAHHAGPSDVVLNQE